MGGLGWLVGGNGQALYGELRFSGGDGLVQNLLVGGFDFLHRRSCGEVQFGVDLFHIPHQQRTQNGQHLKVADFAQCPDEQFRRVTLRAVSLLFCVIRVIREQRLINDTLLIACPFSIIG